MALEMEEGDFNLRFSHPDCNPLGRSCFLSLGSCILKMYSLSVLSESECLSSVLLKYRMLFSLNQFGC